MITLGWIVCRIWYEQSNQAIRLWASSLNLSKIHDHAHLLQYFVWRYNFALGKVILRPCEFFPFWVFCGWFFSFKDVPRPQPMQLNQLFSKNKTLLQTLNTSVNCTRKDYLFRAFLYFRVVLFTSQKETKTFPIGTRSTYIVQTELKTIKPPKCHGSKIFKINELSEPEYHSTVFLDYSYHERSDKYWVWI